MPRQIRSGSISSFFPAIENSMVSELAICKSQKKKRQGRRNMSHILSIQPTSVARSSSKRRRLVMSISLWTVQVVLALLFLFAGSMKLILPIEMMTAQMTVRLSGLFLRFIGVAEVAGAIGLILP